MTTTNFVVNLAVDHCCLSRRRSFLNQTTFINYKHDSISSEPDGGILKIVFKVAQNEKQVIVLFYNLNCAKLCIRCNLTKGF
jgi:hypothetical protein